jgi:3' terminal RNA ribose 2'-O-methyltransferase Hen1
MLLSITNSKSPATDLGYLLHKNPARVQSFELSFGKAHVFYPETSSGRCTAALLLDVDPVGLVRNRRGPAGEGGMLDRYVNDRPYVASSFMSVAFARVFASALAGNNSKGRQELVTVPLPLTARIAVLPCRGGEEFLRRLFEPLGYQVTAEHHPLDEKFPEWGEGPYYTVELSNEITLQNLLAHLYVLIPVLDADKHYWVGKDEIEKLLRRGEGWLQSHPEREAIVNRYLRGQRKLTREALARLTEEEAIDPDEEQGRACERLAVPRLRTHAVVFKSARPTAAAIRADRGGCPCWVGSIDCGSAARSRLLT